MKMKINNNNNNNNNNKMATSLVIVLSKLQQIFMYMVAEGGEA
jgi:hypothetical protein